MSAPRVGVLALQGGVEPHAVLLERLGTRPRPVRAPEDLAGLSHLVLPGGESTTLARLLALFGTGPALAARVRGGSLALLATCAGAILVARDAGGRPPTLGLLDVDVERNAYGTQIDSFARRVELAGGGSVHGLFIRAPRLTRVGPGVRVVARADGDPVVVQGPGILAATFHPELAGDAALHERFLALQPARHPRRLEGSAP